MLGSAHHHRIVAAGLLVELAKVMVGCRLGKAGSSSPQVAVIDVNQCHDVLGVPHRAHVVAPAPAAADDGNIELRIRRFGADDGGKSKGAGSGRSLEKTAS